MGSIYRERNEINLKCYIGKSHVDAVKRSQKHRKGKGSRLLKSAIAKYGIENFTFEILHDGVLDEFLDDYEKSEIKKHNCVAPNGYNLTYGGEGNLGYTPTQETKRKLSELNKGKTLSEETKRKLSESHKGYVPSEEHRRKLSEVNTGKTLSEEHRRKIGLAHKGKKRGKIPKAVIEKRTKTRLGMSPEALTILIDWLSRDGWSDTKIAHELRKNRRTIRKYKTKV